MEIVYLVRFQIKYMALQYILNKLEKNEKEDINICEGVFDAMAIGENSIPIFGKFLPKILKIKLKEENVIRVNIVLDNDAKSESIKLCEYLQSENIDVRIIEMNEGSDPSTLGHDKMKKLLQDSKTVDFAYFVDLIVYFIVYLYIL